MPKSLELIKLPSINQSSEIITENLFDFRVCYLNNIFYCKESDTQVFVELYSPEFQNTVQTYIPTIIINKRTSDFCKCYYQGGFYDPLGFLSTDSLDKNYLVKLLTNKNKNLRNYANYLLEFLRF